jgi:protein-S-isoprenylcysteine O-methyltransferase Ste14
VTDKAPNSLEVKIPPPAVAAAIALAMWGTSRLAPLVRMPGAWRPGLSLALLLAGLVLSAAGVLAFRGARTTVNPTKPERTSSLVTSGVYRFTRNPMYLGIVCLLVAWAVFLSSGWALLGAVAFVLYITRFQITPEERALAKLFGSEFAAYQARVRRWL